MKSVTDAILSLSRPVVFDYKHPVAFLKDLLAYYKATKSFSLRQRTSQVGTCSQALISQILNSQRQLTRDNFPGVAAVFKLTKPEQEFIEQQLRSQLLAQQSPEIAAPAKKNHEPKNHVLSDWLHPYVKDLVNIRGFSPEPKNLHRLLMGISSPEKIQRSVDFLLREGFWRRTVAGDIIPEDSAVITTNEIPNEKIRQFHKKALEIAAKGISELPPSRRKASTVLLSVDDDHVDELRSLIDSFQKQLLDFIEKHPKGSDSLIQVAIHMTPIGGQHEK
ncbi:hypothetical protein D3C87_144150 [compost metagenome]